MILDNRIEGRSETRESPATDSLQFTLNTLDVVVREIAPQTTLLTYLRSLGLTGAKEGCSEGACGSCAVLFIKDSSQGTRYTPVNSCLIPVAMAAGEEVLTVEGLATKEGLCEAQHAIIKSCGSQCGYCTPGFIVSMFAEQHRRDRRPPQVDALAGNLCRCTGYGPIRSALLSLGSPPRGAHLDRLERSAPKLRPFRYSTDAGQFTRPKTLAECIDLIRADPATRLVAGHTDLGVLTNTDGQRFAHLVAVDNLAELRRFEETADFVEIGAALSLAEIGDHWPNPPLVIQECLGRFGSPLIRNRATVGGNLATASPEGDTAPMLLALDATVLIDSSEGSRAIKATQFLSAQGRTDLRPGEIIRSIRIPKPFPSQSRFFKVARRSLNDRSTLTAAIALWRHSDGRIQRTHIAFGGVGSAVLRATAAEAVLEGGAGDEAQFDLAADKLTSDIPAKTDHRGSAGYRLALARGLIKSFYTGMHRGSVI